MTQKSPDRDTTIEDIHATRRRIAEKFGHDLAANRRWHSLRCFESHAGR
jgi:hypothetical protein